MIKDIRITILLITILGLANSSYTCLNGTNGCKTNK